MPDIVLADWVMPIFDGLELTQMIRQPGANADLDYGNLITPGEFVLAKSLRERAEVALAVAEELLG